MTAPKKKGRPQAPKNRKRLNRQFTLAPAEIAIIDKWVDRAGAGTASIQVGMAIRYADRKGLFDDDRADAAQAGREHALDHRQGPQTLEGAVAESLPRLFARLGEEALKRGTGKSG